MKKLLLLLVILQAASAYAEQHIEVTPGVQKISIDGNASNTARSINISDDMILTATENLVTNEQITSVVYSCEDTEANGSKGDWNDFYNVSPSQKADRLAQSIKGVGEKTAPYLVPYFSAGKPHSWSAFSSLILKASREMEKEGINAGWASQVLYRYKQENIKNLGYLAANCDATVKVYTYSNREKIRDLTALVKVKVQNLSLLPGETEKMSVSYDGKRVTASARSTYNEISSKVSYSDYGNRYDTSATVMLIGNSRRQVTPENLIDSSRSNISNDGTLTLAHPAYLELMRNPTFAENCKVIASASVVATTGSFWNSKERATSAAKNITLDLQSTQTTASLGNLGLKDKDTIIKLFIRRF